MSDKGLTGIREEARGFVGRKPLFDFTKKGRARIRFDIYCGENNIEAGEYSTLRHCVAYGEQAENLKLLDKGSLVKCVGWITSEHLRDENNNIVIYNGTSKIIERLILYKGEVQSYEKSDGTQLPLNDKAVVNA